ncbi:uncharacterized protein LOC124630134 [Helicoverpa zea]|uniref:uncharacterized protein LOC124630134 n=1 Tax=Helicoverpa zea TaxID=7113 RepID=UPI001F560F70|nr:uncharacterized protein LOC124630134 [Helicoverpa zea]
MLKGTHLFVFVLIFVGVSSDINYGSFNLTVTGVDICKGPKHKDCSSMTVQLTEHNLLKYDINVTQTLLITKGKIMAIQAGREHLRLHMKKPCEHLFLRPIFQTFFNVTKDCAVLKGRYQYNVDVQKITQSYYGGNFLLGNFIFKSMFYSDDCNFYCAGVKVTLF